MAKYIICEEQGLQFWNTCGEIGFRNLSYVMKTDALSYVMKRNNTLSYAMKTSYSLWVQVAIHDRS